jgi:hypothetical protein
MKYFLKGIYRIVVVLIAVCLTPIWLIMLWGGWSGDREFWDKIWLRED